MQPDYSLRTFTGHSASVLSLDFHPNKEDIICSCDSNGEVRCWSINNGSCVTCVRVFNVCNTNSFSLHFSLMLMKTVMLIIRGNLLLLPFHILSSQGSATQLRFQPRQGKYVAATSEKISILDAETLQVCRSPLQVC